MKKIYFKSLLILFSTSAFIVGNAQEVDLENIGKKTKEELKKILLKLVEEFRLTQYFIVQMYIAAENHLLIF